MTRRSRGGGAGSGRIPRAPAAVKAAVERFQLALGLHQKGEVAKAETLYREILAKHPRHADTLHLLGVARHQQGDAAAGAEFIARAIAVSPLQPFFHCNHGNVLKELGRREEAYAAYREALRLKPDYAEAWYNFGVALAAGGRLQEALEAYDSAIAANPGLAFAFNNRGNLLKELGRFEDCLASYGEAIRLNPGFVDAWNNRGIALQDMGRLEEAVASYDGAIRLRPGNADAFYNRGTALKKLGRAEEALASYDAAIRIRPSHAESHNNRGTTLRDLGRLEDALASVEEAIRLRPLHADAHNNRGITLQELNRPEEALACYDEALRLNPGLAEALANRGVTLLDLKRPHDAIDSHERALALRPGHAESLTGKGNALKELNRREEALACYDEAIRNKPEHAAAHIGRGLVLEALSRFGEALESYDAAIRAKPEGVDGHAARANLLRKMKRFEAALASIEEALRIKPGHAPSFNNRANILKDMYRFDEALASYDEAIRLKPDGADAHNNKGILLQDMGRMNEALACFGEAIRLKPEHAHAFNNRGNAYKAIKRFDEALADYDEAMRLDPGYGYTPGVAAHVTCALGRWSDLEDRVTRIARGVEDGRGVTLPFALLALADDPQLHRKASEIWVRDKVAATGALGPLPPRPRTRRIHVAYLSADFQDHATTHLMAELFELHDRERFAFTGLSFGPSADDRMRRRVSAAFDRFEDVGSKTEVEIARLCRNLGVDIAVDLKGYTADSRPGIFAERCAPVQINWLGYPGTMGGDFMDYIIADHTIIGPEDLGDYSEKVIWLPDTYQCNDGKRPPAQDLLTRADCGLPERGFVFCCFNNNYKILPGTFAVWMRVLKRVPDSVLWLLEDNPRVSVNLRAEAKARGVDPDRLVFAKRLSIQEHLARHRHADLFLDSWPYNAHTTASDALWTGVPVVTYRGRSFAARVAASLLNAVGLPELITASESEFEDLAVALAADPPRLQGITRRLEANRGTAPLFDCARFTRNIEAGYAAAIERHWRGEAPAHIDVAAGGRGGPEHAPGM